MAFSVLLPAISLPLAAQESTPHATPDTPDSSVFELGQVTVIGVAAPQLPVSLSTTVLRRDQLRAVPGAPLGRAVEQVPGVRVIGTGLQVAKPVIRGLSGARVLVADAGHRIEDYSWSEEDAPSADLGLAGEVQVTRGPASLRYGSDAIGGVINVLPLALPTARPDRSPLRPVLQVDAASNNMELGGVARAEGFGNGIGWRLSGAGRIAQDYAGPRGDVPHTGFVEANAEAAAGRVGPRGVTTVRLAHHGGEYKLIEAGAAQPAADEGPERKSLDDRLQLSHELPLGAGTSLAFRGQVQRHSLVELSDECGQPTCPPGSEQVAFDLLLNTGTAEVALQHALGTLVRGTVGASGLAQRSRSAGPVYLVPSGTTRSAALFLIEEATLARLTLSGGVRADRRSLDSEPDSRVPVSPGPPILAGPTRESWSATSADAGATLALLESLSLAANYGTAWRAPTLFELYTNGPHLAESRWEVGDPSLRPERSHEWDLSLRWRSGAVRAELGAFRNDVDDFIYTAPTSAFVNGLRVFEHRSTDARLAGGEAAVDIALGRRGIVRARHEIVRGTDRRAGEPLPLIAPQRTIVGAELAPGLVAHAPRLSVDVTHVARQDRPNPDDIVTGAYTTLDIGAGMVFGSRLPWYGSAPLAVDLVVRNATNARYRDFLSRYKEFADEQGRNVILRLSIAR
ncbi:MAG TPA: TonB-dependent receptor [Gemmatimonadaceae bacterium]|nr:TonB-dependent receptor [Gemmatimonadaceae bacterium]